MLKKYRLKADRILRDETCGKAGDIVYDIKGHDYGLASDDTRAFSVEHISVTLDEDGGYPSFTVPVTDLEELP